MGKWHMLHKAFWLVKQSRKSAIQELVHLPFTGWNCVRGECIGLSLLEDCGYVPYTYSCTACTRKWFLSSAFLPVRSWSVQMSTVERTRYESFCFSSLCCRDLWNRTFFIQFMSSCLSTVKWITARSERSLWVHPFAARTYFHHIHSCTRLCLRD